MSRFLEMHASVFSCLSSYLLTQRDNVLRNAYSVIYGDNPETNFDTGFELTKVTPYFTLRTGEMLFVGNIRNTDSKEIESLLWAHLLATRQLLEKYSSTLFRETFANYLN